VHRNNEAAAQRKPLTPLQAARLARGWSQARLIVAIQESARALGVAIQGRPALKVSISKWENGRSEPSDTYQRLFRIVYKMSNAELGFGATGTSAELVFPASWREGITQASTLWAEDTSGAIGVADFRANEFAPTALRWLLGERDIPQHTSGMRIGSPHVEAIRQMTNSMRAIDNQYGGGYARGRPTIRSTRDANHQLIPRSAARSAHTFSRPTTEPAPAISPVSVSRIASSSSIQPIS
jgi:hypothetical protein